jgi:serine/threonine protein kinase
MAGKSSIIEEQLSKLMFVWYVKEVEALPDFNKISFPQMKAIPLSAVIPHASVNDISFLSSLLQLNPKKRQTAKEALSHAYFLQNPLPYPPADLPVPKRTMKKVDGESLNEQALTKLVHETFLR